MRLLRLLPLWILSVTFLGVLFWAAPARANILGNPSFEAAIGDGTADNWDNTNGTTRITSPPSTFSAFPDGSAAIQQTGTSNYTFQVKKDIQAGDLVVFSVQAESSVTAGGGSGGQSVIEFKGIDGDTKAEFVISTVTSALITATNAPNGSGYVTFTISGRAPEGIGLVVFTLRRQGSNAGNVVFDNANGEINPVGLTLSVSKTTVKPGEVITVVADFKNNSTQSQSNVELKVNVPAGLEVLADTIRNNGNVTSYREGSTIIFVTSTLPQNGTFQVVFQVLVTSGVTLGKAYEIVATVIAGDRISGIRSVTLRIRGDPLFDEGTILGKVFDDRNEDGMQTKGEIGVPRVRIYTEYGVSVVTDADGRFHIPAVAPGRHVLKVDGHTLPEGTVFVTEESLVVKTTPGLLNKIRFAVRLPESALPAEFKKDLQIWVTQGIDLTKPELRVTLNPELLKVGLGRLEREPAFRIKTNYGDYIAGWRIEILDEMGEKIWTGTGISHPPAEIPWNGMTDSNEIIPPGTYAYRLVVRDSKDREDWTPLQFFRVVHKAEGPEAGEKPLEIPSTGAFNISRDGKRAIPLVAKPTVRIYGKTQPNRRVRVGEVPVEVGPTGEFEQELFVTPGEKTLSVSATSPKGDTVTVEEKLTVKDSFFFMVALGEEELGVNIMKGNLETVARDDSYHEGFYQNGRLSYYLKAKIKGKFLVKSRYDTSDPHIDLFTHLDPDDYYPIYGDYSQIEYEGQETQQRFFLLVEMDRSFLQWGSYQTGFTDTELSRFNRTLSGFKLHHETLSTTKYGDSKKGFSLFWSKEKSLGDHNEFRATGGSLYYLRNRNLLQGSEKIRVETRDKIQDVPVQSRNLVAGRDYEIDYRQGRILLRQPLSSVSTSDTIISNDILDGNPVFLIVDYEFETFRQVDDKTAGLRMYTHLGDHIRVGGTAVEDQRHDAKYYLRGVDATIRAGRNTKVTMEVAEAKLQQVRQAVSYNGGLSFRNQGPVVIRQPREDAYQIKAESKPVEPLELSGYIQRVQPGFSIDTIKSQEGYQKYGLQARLKVTQAFYLLARHDSSEVSAMLRPLSQYSFSAPYEKIRSTTGQAVYDHEKWKVVAEYLHQELDIPIQNRINSFFSEMPFGNAVGLKVARRVSDWLTPYVKSQYTFTGKNNYQVGGGVEARVGEHTKATFEEMAGAIGDATALAISHQQDEKTTSYATIKVREGSAGAKRVSTSFGSSHQLSEKSRIYSEREYSTYTGNLPLSLTPDFGADSPGIWSSDIYGYETQLRDRWDLGLRLERRRLDAEDFRQLNNNAVGDLGRTNNFNTLSGSVNYNDPKKLKWSDSVELRLEPAVPRIRQWVTQNSAEWTVTRDLSFLGRANFGTSRFLDPKDLTGRFFEVNVGFAYRPVDFDRFNALAKYTFLDELASDAQFSGTDSGSIETDESAHIFSVEGAYELTKSLQMVEKFAYRLGSFKNALTTAVDISTYLWIHRFNYHLTRKWDVGIEYRLLFQGKEAEALRHGPLVEIDRELYDYVRLGIGYNFTDFEDDLRKINSFKRNAVFVRLSGKV